MQFALAWTRPERPDFPALWARHEFKDPVSGITTTYRIQDATPDLHEQLLDMYLEDYFSSEAMSKCLKVLETDEAMVQEYCFLIKTALTQRVSVAVLEEREGEPPRLAGAMVLAVLSTGDPEFPEFQSVSMQKMWGVLQTLREKQLGGAPQPKEYLYMCDVGLCVRRDRQRRGLGLAILRVLPDMCRAFGVPHFSTPFTGANSQRLADNAGYKVYAAVSYADCKNEDGSPHFPDMPEDQCKLMGFEVVLSGNADV